MGDRMSALSPTFGGELREQNSRSGVQAARLQNRGRHSHSVKLIQLLFMNSSVLPRSGLLTHTWLGEFNPRSLHTHCDCTPLVACEKISCYFRSVQRYLSWPFLIGYLSTRKVHCLYLMCFTIEPSSTHFCRCLWILHKIFVLLVRLLRFYILVADTCDFFCCFVFHVSWWTMCQLEVWDFIQ